MKKIFFLLLLLPFFADAQLPQDLKTWGFKTRRIFPDTLQGLPADTFSVPSAYRTLPFLAAKHDTLYIWNLTYWKLFSGGGEATTASNALTLVGSDVRLGGDMTGNTTISMHNNRILTFDSVSQFLVKRSGVTRFSITTGSSLMTSPNGSYGYSISNANTLMTGATIDITSTWTDLAGGQGTLGMLDSIYMKPYLGAINIDSLQSPTVEGSLMIWGGNGNGRVSALAPSTSGYVLTTQGNSLPPAWVAQSSIVSPENGTQLVGGKIHLGGAMTKSDTLTQGVYPASNYNLVFTKDISGYNATYPTTTNIISSAGWTQRSIDGGNIIINYQDSAAAAGDNYPGLYLQSGFNSTTALAFGVHNQPADHHGFIDLRAASNLTSFGIEYNGTSWLLLKTNGLMFMGHAVGAKRLQLGGVTDPGQTLTVTGSISNSDSVIHSNLVRLTDTTGFDVAMINRTTGNMKKMYAGLIAGSSGLTVGTTAIASGTNGRFLYDNSGVLGEGTVGYGLSGTSTHIVDTATLAAKFWTLNLNAASGVTRIGTNSNNSFNIYTNNTYRGRWDSTAAMLLIGSPTFDANQALNIQSLTNTSGDGIRLWAANLTASSKYSYDRIESSGANKIGAASGAVQLYGASGASVNISTSAAVPTSTLTVDGSFGTKYVAKTGTYPITATDNTIDCTSGTFTVTLPTAVSITGREYTVSNSGSGTITIATTSSQTFTNINATPTTLTLSPLGSGVITAYTFKSTGANWIVKSYVISP